MKIGETLICKHDIVIPLPKSIKKWIIFECWGKDVRYYKGKKYKILYITDSHIQVLTDSGRVSFTRERQEDQLLISDYFYTEKELLNKKLQKIK